MILQIDSTAIYHAIQTGITIGESLNHNKDFIKGVPNAIFSSIVTGVASLVLGFLHRKKTLKRLRKTGQLND
jgi:hypothetical protein